MLRRLKILLGIYDLRDACVDRVIREFGASAVPNFLEIYDMINRGEPINIIIATATIDFVEETKKELKQQTILARIISWLGKKKENKNE